MVECGIFAFSEFLVFRLMEESIDLLFQGVRSVLLLQLLPGGDVPAYSRVQFYLCEQFVHTLFQVLV